MEFIKSIEKQINTKAVNPKFKSGDTVTVHYKIKEGTKERIQLFQGVVLQRKGNGATETFTVRKISGGVGVERIFPLNSTNIAKVDVNKQGIVRRARLYYLRGKVGKGARILEKRQFAKAAVEVPSTPEVA